MSMHLLYNFVTAENAKLAKQKEAIRKFLEDQKTIRLYLSENDQSTAFQTIRQLITYGWGAEDQQVALEVIYEDKVGNGEKIARHLPDVKPDIKVSNNGDTVIDDEYKLGKSVKIEFVTKKKFSERPNPGNLKFAITSTEKPAADKLLKDLKVDALLTLRPTLSASKSQLQHKNKSYDLSTEFFANRTEGALETITDKERFHFQFFSPFQALKQEEIKDDLERIKDDALKKSCQNVLDEAEKDNTKLLCIDGLGLAPFGAPKAKENENNEDKKKRLNNTIKKYKEALAKNSLKNWPKDTQACAISKLFSALIENEDGDDTSHCVVFFDRFSQGNLFYRLLQELPSRLFADCSKEWIGEKEPDDKTKNGKDNEDKEPEDTSWDEQKAQAFFASDTFEKIRKADLKEITDKEFSVNIKDENENTSQIETALWDNIERKYKKTLEKINQFILIHSKNGQTKEQKKFKIVCLALPDLPIAMQEHFLLKSDLCPIVENHDLCAFMRQSGAPFHQLSKSTRLTFTKTLSGSKDRNLIPLPTVNWMFGPRLENKDKFTGHIKEYDLDQSHIRKTHTESLNFLLPKSFTEKSTAAEQRDRFLHQVNQVLNNDPNQDEKEFFGLLARHYKNKKYDRLIPALLLCASQVKPSVFNEFKLNTEDKNKEFNLLKLHKLLNEKQEENKNLRLYPDVIKSGNIVDFCQNFMLSETFDISESSVEYEDEKEKEKITLKGKTRSFGYEDTDVQIIFDEHLGILRSHMSFGLESDEKSSGFTVPGIDALVTTGIKATYVTTESYLPTQGYIEGSFDLGVKGTLSFNFPIVENKWVTTATFKDQEVSISNITDLTCGIDISKYLISPFKDIANISAREVTFVTDLRTSTLDFLSVALKTADEQPITLIDGILTINDISFNFQVLSPTKSKTTSFDSYGHIQIDETKVFLSAAYPGEPRATRAGQKDPLPNWVFTGNTLKDDRISLTALLNKFCATWGASLPKGFPELSFKDLNFRFETGTKKLSFGGALDIEDPKNNIPVGKERSYGVEFVLKVDSELKNKERIYTGGLTGTIEIGKVKFLLTYDFGDKKKLFKAKWQGEKDQKLGINEILDFLGLGSLDIPENLDLFLKYAEFKYDFQNKTIIFLCESANYGKADFVAYYDKVNENWRYFSGFAVGHNINLSNLPLINQVFSEKHRLAIENICIAVGSENADKDKTEAINKLIDNKDYPQVAGDGFIGGVTLSMDFVLAGEPIKLSVSTVDKTSTTKPNTKKVTILPPSTNTPTQLVRSTLANTGNAKDKNKGTEREVSADGTNWFKIQKKIGPVTFEKLGIKYKAGHLTFALNSSLSTSGMTLELMTAAVDTPLKHFKPSFSLDGIGMDYKNPSLQIDGSFLKIPGPDFNNYGGGAIFATKAFSLDAMGAYNEVDDQTSMFVFAQVDRKFGGPPCFVVTGILGGFGYNSELRIPELDKINDLPLISGLDHPEKIGGKKSTPIKALKTLINNDEPWVTPSPGNIWLAAGIKFNSYKLVESTALVVGQFNKDFSLAILGVSKGSFPEGKGKKYAVIEMDLRAYFAPSQGELSFCSTLSPSSFTLDKSCQVTGGFAMCFWFGNHKHAGDFVVSMGGYSPFFKAPEWYPKLPRVGMNWVISSEVSMTGAGYFAMCPSAIMAGGELKFQFHVGCLRAWAKGNADIVIWFDPFYFVLDIGVRVGASVSLGSSENSKKISVEMGCKLGLWGPATGGKIKIKILFIISVSIPFGASRRKGMDKLSWEEFSKTLPEADAAVDLVPINGLTPRAANAEDQQLTKKHTQGVQQEEKEWLIRPHGFEFNSDSKIPCSELYLGEKSKEPTFVQKDKKGKTTKLNIRPMSKTDLTSSQRLYIKRNIGKNTWTELDLKSAQWTIKGNKQNVAKALWGTGPSQMLSAGNDQLIRDQYTGFKLTAPPPKLADKAPGEIDIKKHFTYFFLPEGENALRADLNESGPLVIKDKTSVGKIEKIMDEIVKKQRDALHGTFADLGLNGVENGDLTHLSQRANELYIQSPLTVQK